MDCERETVESINLGADLNKVSSFSTSLIFSKHSNSKKKNFKLI